MIEIPLTQGLTTVIDDEDAELADFKWCALVTKDKTPLKYAVRSIRINGKKTVLYLHRAILERVLERGLASREFVDHAFGGGLDNRRCNLRLASNSQNQANQKMSVRNTSGYRGVGWISANQKWQGRIQVNGKLMHLGYFTSSIDAARAYNEAALLYFGEFASLNPTPANTLETY